MKVSLEKPGTPAELVHAGIKGMKWGIRKKREVSPERKAKREAKAQKFVKKASSTQTKIDVMKAKPKQNFGQRLVYNRNARISQLEQTKAQALKDAESKRQGKLSRRQKQVIVGGAVVGLLVAGGVLAVTINSGQARQVMNRGKAFVTRKEFAFKTNDAFKERDLTPDALHTIVSKGINPDYGNKKGAGMNCRRATFAYEMRRRGYDVEATKSPTASGQNAAGLLNAITTKTKDISTGNLSLFRRMIKDDRHDPATRHVRDFTKRGSSLRDIKPERSGEGLPLSNIFKRLSQEPERSRGEVVTMWETGGAHSMSYEIINGAAHIFDNQTGQHYRPDVRGIGEIDLPGIASAGFTRLDNINLDENYLQRWVK
jgi:hypothetical protein